MLQQPRHGSEPGQVAVRRSLATGSAALLLTSLAVGAPSTATAKDTSQAAAAVISEWNEIAQKTLLADTAKAIPEDFLYMGFVHAAVYNAVIGIEGGYQPYRFRTTAPQGASSQAAAVAAAHKILLAYSPAAQHADLNTAYTASLAKIPDGDAETSGVTFGELAADTLIKQRAHDGRNGPITYSQQPAPGVWRPTPAPTTPPNLSPFAVPWLGSVTPLLVKAVTSSAYPEPHPK
jgi:hypothetical protein